MTRIFDALRKARTLGTPPGPSFPPAPVGSSAHDARVPTPGPPVVLARGGEPSAALLPPPTLVPLPSLLSLSDEVQREMGTLRVHIEAALTERTPRTVMVMSAQGGEGTTTVATQFATTLARDDSLRVLLVDAHGRRPALSKWVASDAQRRAGAIAKRKPDSADPGPAAERLRLLPLGGEYWNPNGIAAQSMRQLLDSVEANFDWIIVDGPPVLESPDAASLAAVADGVAIVVQAGRTKRPVLSRSVDLLRKAGAHVLGTVLNRRRLEIPGFIYRRI